MTLTDYISKVNFQYQTGNTTEHSFRGFLRDYVAEIAGSGINVINEPKRTACGAPPLSLPKLARIQLINRIL